MSNLYSLFATPEDRDASRAAAERYHLLQSVAENPVRFPRAWRPRKQRLARARALV